MYYVYILYSLRIEKYYIGSTDDLSRRLQEHERGKTTFSKNGTPWELKYYEVYVSRSDAYKRELEIKKKKSRKYIEQLISAGSDHPGV
jgi:putative endonuclease